MNTFSVRALAACLLALGTLLPGAGLAQEAVIRKNLAERVPQLARIDEVRPTAVPGLFEIRVNDSDIYYTDAQGQYLIQGQLIDLRQRRNLTQERIDQLTALDFKDLPLKDAFTTVRGDGRRKIAVFADPNCTYCKRFERDLSKLDNVTIHTFLYPILNPDSAEKSRNIWCAKDRSKSWQSWMLDDVAPAPAPAASCDASALQRNLALGRKHRITGTPTMILADGTRVPGAINAQQLEKLLAQASR